MNLISFCVSYKNFTEKEYLSKSMLDWVIRPWGASVVTLLGPVVINWQTKRHNKKIHTDEQRIKDSLTHRHTETHTRLTDRQINKGALEAISKKSNTKNKHNHAENLKDIHMTRGFGWNLNSLVSIEKHSGSNWQIVKELRWLFPSLLTKTQQHSQSLTGITLRTDWKRQTHRDR